ncbi:hypothetical protein LLEC1_06654 [Akanthomyces lecanii]|uniref:Mitochondrial outer membrane transport complex Sam37/metaxin N-terminal domain-containing protein n=1 Tax=Cordyceps confragosa TaxID=2714763 RepID=A0A179IE07_CORDF|nr:hypothetical protein LLEC1_06654 [Akanthomyces lecanii]
MLELHVWGPVFGVPSIDAECIAAITYLHNAVCDGVQFRIVPSNDASVSPSSMFHNYNPCRCPHLYTPSSKRPGFPSSTRRCLHHTSSAHHLQPCSYIKTLQSCPADLLALPAPKDLLPALNHDGVWTSGYRAIVRYLVSESLAADHDAELTAVQRADVAAFSAYLGVHASALLDLSLYAIRRVEHLGLAELDTDFDPHGGLHLTAGRDALPETFRKHLPGTPKHRNTVKEEMTPEQAVAIRLFSLTEDCLGTLETLLSKEQKRPRFFSGQDLTSLDCLAFGYLALMLKAPVPRAFLKDWTTEHAPCVTAFVNDILVRHTPPTGGLPWIAAPQRGYLHATSRVLDSIVRHTPVLGGHYASEVRRRCQEKTVGVDQRAVSLLTGLLFTGATFGYLTYRYRNLAPFGARSQTWRSYRSGSSRLSQFGQLGSMLNSVLGPVQPAASPMTAGAGTGGRIVDIDSEVVD